MFLGPCLCQATGGFAVCPRLLAMSPSFEQPAPAITCKAQYRRLQQYLLSSAMSRCATQQLKAQHKKLTNTNAAIFGGSRDGQGHVPPQSANGVCPTSSAFADCPATSTPMSAPRCSSLLLTTTYYTKWGIQFMHSECQRQ
jgi:hypothetical protein